MQVVWEFVKGCGVLIVEIEYVNVEMFEVFVCENVDIEFKFFIICIIQVWYY